MGWLMGCLLLLLLAGCVPHHQRQAPLWGDEAGNQPIGPDAGAIRESRFAAAPSGDGGALLRAERLFLLIDESESMDEPYQGLSRLDYAETIVSRLLARLPLSAPRPQLIRIGSTAVEGDESGRLLAGTVASALRQLAASDEWQGGQRKAIVVVSRWQRFNRETERAIDALSRSSAGSEICVHAIGTGDRYSRPGRGCGLQVAADTLLEDHALSDWIRRILYTLPPDSDGDGIPDRRDRCPATEAGRLIGADGCLRFPREGERGGAGGHN